MRYLLWDVENCPNLDVEYYKRRDYIVRGVTSCVTHTRTRFGLEESEFYNSGKSLKDSSDFAITLLAGMLVQYDQNPIICFATKDHFGGVASLHLRKMGINANVIKNPIKRQPKSKVVK